MPIMLNTLLVAAGLPLSDVRLLRHKDKRATKGRSPYELWRDNRPQFELYQSSQSIENRKKLAAPYWAVFIDWGPGTLAWVQYAGAIRRFGDWRRRLLGAVAELRPDGTRR